MPRRVYSACLLALFVGLLAAGLASCQRASYSFQAPAAPASYGPVGADTSARLLATYPSAVLHPRLRRAPGRHLGRPAAHRVPGPLLATGLAAKLAAELPAGPARRGVARAMAARPAQVPTPGTEPGRQRSRGIALLLAVVPLLLLGLPLGLHNFYLGYHGRGILSVLLTAAALVVLFVTALLALLVLFGGASGGVVVLFVLAAAFYYFLYIRQIIDIVRIVKGDLKPKDGEYYPRLFQTRAR